MKSLKKLTTIAVEKKVKKITDSLEEKIINAIIENKKELIVLSISFSDNEIDFEKLLKKTGCTDLKSGANKSIYLNDILEFSSDYVRKVFRYLVKNKLKPIIKTWFLPNHDNLSNDDEGIAIIIPLQ